jgi:hypothetical protein
MNVAQTNGWTQLLTALDTAGKNVALDLSTSWRNPNGDFTTGSNAGTGIALASLHQIESIILPYNASVTSIGNSAFRFLTNLTSVTIGNNVTSIGQFAFVATGLTSIVIPDSVITIDLSAFSQSTALRNVTIGNSVTSIGNNAFDGCTSLTSVTLPNNQNFRIIGNYMFSNTALTSIVIPNSVTTIGNNAFERCTTLTSIVLPNSVTSIGQFAFSGCTGLTSVILPNNPNFTTINLSTFANSGLTSIVIPNSVTSIGNRAFQDCTSLASVTIGSGVTSIGEDTFRNCASLTTVNFEGNTPPTIGGSVFLNTHSTLRILVPATRASVYRAAANFSATDVRNRIHSVGCQLDNPTSGGCICL